MGKRSISRVDHEASEQLPDVKSDVPDNKYQKEQQIQNSSEALDMKPLDSSFSKKSSSVKGSSLKQEAIADMVSGSVGASGMGINGGGRSVSGTVGGVLGANNSTPAADKARSDSRFGKKLDRIATKLNYTPSEQVTLKFDESKPLADSSNEDQGYNGTYRNEDARSQKIHGAVPGDLMFQRSVDLITKDKLYYVEGQQVFQVSGDKTELNPSIVETINDDGTIEDTEVTYHSGNFIHRGLHFGLKEDGKVDYFFADVEDFTPSGVVNPEIANVSSAHRLIKSNVAELDRQVMDSKAGDEKAELWTPLARAIKQPTRASYLMSSMEAETGAYALLAYSKASTCFSYQLNRGPKDGLNEIGPGIEFAVGWRYMTSDPGYVSSVYDNKMDSIFDSDYYDLGDPSLMIAAYDSSNKYKNKADLLLQPRGFRMHLQTADNNINPLKVPTEFANVFAGQETFSTIDREYDPLMPICMTDKANLVLVHNLNELAGFCHTVKHINFTYSSTNIEHTYKYKSIVLIKSGTLNKLGYTGNMYVLYKKNKGDGLKYTSGTGVIEMDPDNANLTDANIDIVLSKTNSLTGYTLIATYAVNSDFDLTFHLPIEQTYDGTVISSVTSEYKSTETYYNGARPYSYVYSDLRNYYSVDVKHPLIEGMRQYLENSIGGKMYSLLGSKHELYIPMVFSTQFMTLAQLFICAATPWITRVRVNSMKDVIYYEDNVREYPYSKLDSIKNVPFHNYINFNFGGYDSPLETKVMDPAVALQWTMPEFFWKVGSGKYVLPWYFNENEVTIPSEGYVNYDASAMSFPSIRSGIRLGFLDNMYGMTEKDIRLSLDRLTKQLVIKDDITAVKAYKYGRTTDGQPYVEIDSNGFFSIAEVLSCPRELGLVQDAPYSFFTGSNNDGVYASSSTEYASSFAIKIWTNPNTSMNPDILAANGVNINRAANYVQNWRSIYAALDDTDTVVTGLVFGMNDEGSALFKPWGTLGTGSQYSDGPNVISLQRSLWTRLQTLPFVISPFDGHTTTFGGVRDIYDIAYMFGLCGFRASDYRESVYNREKECVNQGLLFVNDPWVQDSPIMRLSSHSTGLIQSKGYEIKQA